jgi:alanine-glyoxylate transaminase/serine-glyoxylate transaminase/serine-pyruvate transaminase
LEVYGANVTQLKAPIGGVATFPQIEEALQKQKYKIITVSRYMLASSAVLTLSRSLKSTLLPASSQK